MFKDGHPVMVDIGSFQKRSSTIWPAYEEFMHTFFLPLLLWSRGEMYLERLIIESDNYPYRVFPSQSPKENEYVQSVLKPVTEYSIRCFHHLYTDSPFLYSKAKLINSLIASVKRKSSSQFIKLRRTYKMISIESINQMTPPQLDNKRLPEQDNRIERLRSFVSDLYCANNHSCLFIGDSSVTLISWIDELVSGQVIVLDRSSNNLDSIYNHFGGKVSVIPVMSSLINPPNVSSFVNRLSSEVVIVYGALESYLKEGFLLAAILERIYSLTEKQVFICTDLSRISIEKGDLQRELGCYFTPRHVELVDNVFYYAGIMG